MSDRKWLDDKLIISSKENVEPAIFCEVKRVPALVLVPGPVPPLKTAITNLISGIVKIIRYFLGSFFVKEITIE